MRLQRPVDPVSILRSLSPLLPFSFNIFISLFLCLSSCNSFNLDVENYVTASDYFTSSL